MRTVLQTAFHLVTGDFTSYLTAASRDGVSLDHQPAGGPGASTLSRARFKLDLFLMLTRQRQWRGWLAHSHSDSDSISDSQHPQSGVHQQSGLRLSQSACQQPGLLPQSQSESQSNLNLQSDSDSHPKFDASASYQKFDHRRRESRIVSIGAFACIQKILWCNCAL